MAYDDATVTTRERKAADNQTSISGQNVKDVQNQLGRQLANYNFADAQNRALADTQLKQISRKNSADRFEAQRALRDSALGLLGSMGSAMNGSTTGNFMNMLRSRNDSDNNTFWAQLQENQDQVENAYNDSLNQNNVARRDAMQSAEKAIRDITGDWRANMNNINPSLFPGGGNNDSLENMTGTSAMTAITGNVPTNSNTVGSTSPIGGKSALGSDTAWRPSEVAMNNSTISGYVIPDNRGVGTTPTGRTSPANAMNVGAARNRVRGGANNAVGGDYFSQMMNRFNGR